MNWYKTSNKKQLSLFDKPEADVTPSTKIPKIAIWGLSPSGILTVKIDNKTYKYDNVTPFEEQRLQSLLNHKNYSQFFATIKNLSGTQINPFSRSLPY